METRMRNIALVLPEAMRALQALGSAAGKGQVPGPTLDLVKLRASQINGCSLCAEMHGREAREAGESDERLFTVAAWRDAPYFSAAERAALALTEAVTRLDDRADPVPDAVWSEAAKHYDEAGLAALIVAIAAINAWNRLNVSTRQVAGSAKW
jgi:AhpD family alkylhydroperoxidase